MEQLSIADFERLTGFTFRTVKRRLGKIDPIYQKGPKVLYDSIPAFKALYATPDGKGKLSLEQERAKLAQVQTKKLELEFRVLKKELVVAEEIIEEFSKRVVAAKTKFLAIPSKLAARFKSYSEPSDLQEVAENLVFEALTEVSESE